MPGESTIRKITSHCGAELIEALNVEELQRKAGDAGLVNLDRVRWTPPWLTRWPSPASASGSDSRRTLSLRIDGYWELTIETDLRDLGINDVVIARTGNPCRQGGPQKRPPLRQGSGASN